MRLGILAVVVSMATACGFSGPGGGNGPDAPGGDDAPPAQVGVAFATGTSLTDHGTPSHVVQVVLSAPATGTVTVNYKVVGGTALAGTDYKLVDGTLTFPTGVIEQDITMQILKPLVDEPDVEVTLALDGPEGAMLGQPSQHHVTISATMLPRITFATGSLNLSETVTSTGISVAIDKMSTVPISVDYKIVAAGTTATGGGVDYTLADGTLTISSGTLGSTIPLVVINDLNDEDDEAIQLQLSNPVNAELGTTPTQFTYTILDDDAPPTVQFTTTATSLPEAAGATSIPVALSLASGKTITVPYTVTLGTASPSDVAVADGTLTFAPGDTTKSIPVNVQQDALDETDETFTLTLGAPTNATLGTNTSNLVTIVDDDPTPTISIATASSSVLESVGTVTLTVSLSAASGQDITVAFAGTGTATEAADYTYVPATHTLAFPAGTISQTIMVVIAEDAADEPNETIVTTLSSPVNATLGTASQTLTVLDDDPTCIGPAGPYQVCLVDMPAGPVSLTANINTTTSGLCLTTPPVGWMPTQNDACFIAGTTITLPAAQMIKVSGGRPLVLVATDSIAIAGTLDVSSRQGNTTGPGNNGACAPYTVIPVGAGNGGGGGAGGSFMSPGGNGGAGNGPGVGNHNAGGGSLGTDPFEPTILRAGCDGQKGAAGNPGQAAGSIGHGGGGVYLLAANTLDLSGGVINASGSGAVGGDFLAGGSGAGSGGMIELYATTITTTAATKLFANGGGGASGADAITSGAMGSDPSAVSITTPAPGGGLPPDTGGRGFASSGGAQSGGGGTSNMSGGGGGGGGGFIQSNQSLGAAAISAGAVD